MMQCSRGMQCHKCGGAHLMRDCHKGIQCNICNGYGHIGRTCKYNPDNIMTGIEQNFGQMRPASRLQQDGGRGSNRLHSSADSSAVMSWCLRCGSMSHNHLVCRASTDEMVIPEADMFEDPAQAEIGSTMLRPQPSAFDHLDSGLLAGIPAPRSASRNASTRVGKSKKRHSQRSRRSVPLAAIASGRGGETATVAVRSSPDSTVDAQSRLLSTRLVVLASKDQTQETSAAGSISTEKAKDEKEKRSKEQEKHKKDHGPPSKKPKHGDASATAASTPATITAAAAVMRSSSDDPSEPTAHNALSSLLQYDD